ncbi:MAG: PEP-CTERM sorting domain-containing protein [Cyanobacteriota bacterium]|nr:PEP-CTERM sorting domain-containing protein [Cyanobacteriota bacterium]
MRIGITPFILHDRNPLFEEIKLMYQQNRISQYFCVQYLVFGETNLMTSAKKLSMGIFLSLLSSWVASSLAPVKANAATINFASASEGARLLDWSSQYSYAELPIQPINGGAETSRNNLLSSAKTAWLNNGETGFIFGSGDTNQKLILDLGQIRSLDQIGARVSHYPNDREVWDYFEVRTSLNNATYTPWGIIGAKDGIVDITESLNSIDRPERRVRYIEYAFGRHSFDNHTVDNKQFSNGSRVLTLYANQTTETPSVPEPTSVLSLFALGILGAGSLAKRKR